MNYSQIGIKHIYLGVFCTLLLLCGCECDTCEEKTYEIFNETNHRIELRMFLSKVERNSIFLNKGGESVVFECNDDDWCFAQLALGSDSISVIFDDLLHWSHRSNPPPYIPINNNILLEEFYQERSEDYFVYRITESDYELAVPIPE